MEDLVGGIRTILAQELPSGTGIVTAYTLAAKTHTYITSIIVCNTSNAVRTYSLYIDPDGSTHDATTAQAINLEIPANSTDEWSFGDSIALKNTGATIGVQNSSSQTVNFTIYGIERAIA